MVLADHVHCARLRPALAGLLVVAHFRADLKIVERGIHHTVAMKVQESAVRRFYAAVILVWRKLSDTPVRRRRTFTYSRSPRL